MKILCMIILVLGISKIVFAQTDWERWDAKKISYTLPNFKTQNSKQSGAKDFVSVSQKLYKKIFSNLDGNNCGFYPSCSSFFVQAVHKTNFITGTLLFIDRFTRDLNYAKSLNNYPFYNTGHFYDPVEKYILH